jgi:hypothetical protein
MVYEGSPVRGNFAIISIGDALEVTPEVRRCCLQHWRNACELFGLDGLRDREILQSPYRDAGELKMSLWFFGRDAPGAIHKEHGFFELHTQVLGRGVMEKFRENNEKTVYESHILLPGQTHKPFFDIKRGYPWHRYQARTDSILLAVETPYPIPVR